jgi:hypothetical protein
MLTLKSTVLGLATLAILGLAVTPAAHAQPASPIAVTGFNRDVVVGSTDTTANTQTFDAYNEWGFYSTDSAAAGTTPVPGGLPANGVVTSTNGQFQFASYLSNNALLISTNSSISTKAGLPTGTTYSYSPSGTLTLTSAGKYSSIGVMSSDVYGPSTLQVSFTYSDGSTVVSSQALNGQDWYATASNSILSTERIGVGAYSSAPNPTSGNGPKFFEDYFTTDPTKTLSSITFTDLADNTTGGNATGHELAGIFAINGVAAAPEPGETAVLMLGGLGLLGLIARKRRANA